MNRRKWSNPWETLRPKGVDPIWLTSQMIPVRLSQMDNEHLQNLERMLLGRGRVDPPFRQVAFQRWYDIIRDEMDKRGMKPLQQDHQFAIMRQEKDAVMRHLNEASHTCYRGLSIPENTPCAPCDEEAGVFG